MLHSPPLLHQRCTPLARVTKLNRNAVQVKDYCRVLRASDAQQPEPATAMQGLGPLGGATCTHAPALPSGAAAEADSAEVCSSSLSHS